MKYFKSSTLIDAKQLTSSRLMNAKLLEWVNHLQDLHNLSDAYLEYPETIKDGKVKLFIPLYMNRTLVIQENDWVIKATEEGRIFYSLCNDLFLRNFTMLAA